MGRHLLRLQRRGQDVRTMLGERGGETSVRTPPPPLPRCPSAPAGRLGAGACNSPMLISKARPPPATLCPPVLFPFCPCACAAGAGRMQTPFWHGHIRHSRRWRQTHAGQSAPAPHTAASALWAHCALVSSHAAPTPSEPATRCHVCGHARHVATPARIFLDRVRGQQRRLRRAGRTTSVHGRRHSARHGEAKVPNCSCGQPVDGWYVTATAAHVGGRAPEPPSPREATGEAKPAQLPAHRARGAHLHR